MPAAGSLPERLRFAFASCQNFESGHYTAYAHMAREDLDLVVHLGDYIYEGAAHRGRPRLHNSGEIFTLEDYRLRYALYKSDPALRAAHAAAPWIVTWDDHELANNYAGDIPEKPASREEFLRRRAAAYQAYYEMMPLRRAQLPSGPDLLLFRALDFGRLATFHVLIRGSIAPISRRVMAASRPRRCSWIRAARCSASASGRGSTPVLDARPPPGTCSHSR